MADNASRITQTVGQLEEAEFELPEMGQWALVWRRFRRHKLADARPLVLLVVFIFLSFGAPLIAPYPYDKINMNDQYALPSAKYLLGTDELGRDIFSRLLYAGRISLDGGPDLHHPQ